LGNLRIQPCANLDAGCATWCHNARSKIGTNRPRRKVEVPK
jgi:hypothetical protein